ncbi:MAG: putative metal-binding motif-containing protein [Candidatus Aenigmarchaeota archaeon]|nr:putative metal-binding motif-containing protein [Candidatus Aenigmarchaeota archaeon]
MLIMLVLAAGAEAAITVEIEDRLQFYRPGQSLDGMVSIVYDQPVPSAASVVAYIDGAAVSSQQASAYEGNATFQYASQPFGYNITAFGTSLWNETPRQYFSYSFKANGTRTDGSAWSISFGDVTPASVNASEGLRFVRNTSLEFAPPGDAKNDTQYFEVSNGNPNVATTMRAACGKGKAYANNPITDEGWVIPLGFNPASWNQEPGTSNRFTSIESFDNGSLREGFRMFGGPRIFPHGGIYKTPQGSSTPVYQRFGTNAVWDGKTGYIKIINFDSLAKYEITYLPPNGPVLCAHTPAVVPNSTQWSVPAAQSGSVKYPETFTKAYSQQELASLLPLPPCPAYVKPSACSRRVDMHGVAETSDPTNGVEVSFDQAALQVTAIASSPVSTNMRAFSIGFDNFLNLEAPGPLGNHTVSFSLVSQGNAVSSGSANFTVCTDNDGDGVCGGAGDCNDNDFSVHPGAQEVCNGRDDTCDGAIDEGLPVGQACNDWPGSACKGVYVCSTDGSAACNGPGPSAIEVCGNNRDDDCDGLVDEFGQIVEGIPQTCETLCNPGDTRPCGGPSVGECRQGVTSCINGRWSAACEGSVGPLPEVCGDLKDNNCNGQADDPSVCQPVSTCRNGLQDGDEQGVDCGGACQACGGEDTCSNGIEDFDEQGVDCGGACPVKCPGEAGLMPIITVGVGVILLLAAGAFIFYRKRMHRGALLPGGEGEEELR